MSGGACLFDFLTDAQRYDLWDQFHSGRDYHKPKERPSNLSGRSVFGLVPRPALPAKASQTPTGRTFSGSVQTWVQTHPPKPSLCNPRALCFLAALHDSSKFRQTGQPVFYLFFSFTRFTLWGGWSWISDGRKTAPPGETPPSPRCPLPLPQPGRCPDWVSCHWARGAPPHPDSPNLPRVEQRDRDRPTQEQSAQPFSFRCAGRTTPWNPCSFGAAKHPPAKPDPVGAWPD